MKQYSILIVGLNCYYGHIREFVINLNKKNPLVSITLLISPIPGEVCIELNRYVDKVITPKKYENTFKFRPFVRLLKACDYFFRLLELCFKKRFDIVDIHFPTHITAYVMPVLKKVSRNIVISPWGSDVLRADSPRLIKSLTRVYSQANYVTISKDSQIGKCAIDKFKVNPGKLVKLGWGGEFFDYIQENSDQVSLEESKKRFGLQGCYVITCGYNTQKEQRHKEIIHAIQSVKTMLPDNLVLLFPFTYGRTEMSDLYTNSVKEECDSLGLRFVAVEEHLNMEDLFKLRMSTDIFVHIQPTDAGSRCVMEYIYCNKKVVHGAWIKYAYLEDNKPSCYFPVEQMEDLGSVILSAYQSKVDELPVEVKNVIMERSWNNKMKLWNEFFESIVN